MTTANEKRTLARDELNGLALTLLPAIIQAQTAALSRASTSAPRAEGAEGAEAPAVDPAPFYRRCVADAYVAAFEMSKAARSPEMLLHKRVREALAALRDLEQPEDRRIAKAVPLLDAILRGA